MRVIVIGAGEVGSSIAESLCTDHDVVVVDTDPHKVENVTYSMDVLAVEGDGATLEILKEAEVENADIVIASTDDDETNLVACGTAKTASDAFTVARVTETKYLRTWENLPGALGVDFMVASNVLSAEAIVRVVGLPSARDVDRFSDGNVEMANFDIKEGSAVAGLTVEGADNYENLTFAGLRTEEEMKIPSGDTVLNVGDSVIVIGTPESVIGFSHEVAPEDSESELPDDIVIIGGTGIGYEAAKAFSQIGLKTRLIEEDGEKARKFAEDLPNVVVMENDPLDMEFLDRENVDDAVVAALDNDEENLMVSLLAKRAGAQRTISVVENSDLIEVFEEVGVDVPVNPRRVTAQEITRFTHSRQAENVVLVGQDEAEVVEMRITNESVLEGKTIGESSKELPDGYVVGAITRGDKFITPRGDTVIEKGDHVVVFVDAEVQNEVTDKI
ncbi:MAG: Trk system potassium transporter TrkA [Halobacteria archaeon]